MKFKKTDLFIGTSGCSLSHKYISIDDYPFYFPLCKGSTGYAGISYNAFVYDNIPYCT